MAVELGIVIPAYKTKYLDAALASIAAQTNKNFKVYVCDDGSKEDIKSIANKYADQLDLQYHHFDENLGGINLVQHWNRSIALANEEWLWLFSDDDVLSPGCVQAFFDALQLTQSRHNLYRFNIEMINGKDEVICVKEPHPTTETGYEFLKRRLQSKSLSAVVEYVFKKEVFDASNGFDDFPLAYCADDATWLKFASDLSIYTIQSQKIYWRASGINISSSGGFQIQKTEALLKFINHILNKYPQHKNELLQLAEPWFYENLGYIHDRLGFWQAVKLSFKLNALFRGSKPGAMKKIIASQLRNTRFAGKVQKWSGY
jgi:glycosyltransferase involved in cell wall biosynthesis